MNINCNKHHFEGAGGLLFASVNYDSRKSEICTYI